MSCSINGIVVFYKQVKLTNLWKTIHHHVLMIFWARLNCFHLVGFLLSCSELNYDCNLNQLPQYYIGVVRAFILLIVKSVVIKVALWHELSFWVKHAFLLIFFITIPLFALITWWHFIFHLPIIFVVTLGFIFEWLNSPFVFPYSHSFSLYLRIPF